MRYIGIVKEKEIGRLFKRLISNLRKELRNVIWEASRDEILELEDKIWKYFWE